MERQLAAAFGELEEIGRHLTEVAADGRAALKEDRAAPLRSTVDRGALRRMVDTAAAGEAPLIVGLVARVLSQVGPVAASMAVRALWFWHQRLDLPFGAPLTRKRLNALLDAPIRSGVDSLAFEEADRRPGVSHSQEVALTEIGRGLTAVVRGAAVLENSQLDAGMQESADLCPARDNEGGEEEPPKRKRRPVDFGPHQAAVDALIAACAPETVDVVALLKRLGVIKRVPPAPSAVGGSPAPCTHVKEAMTPVPQVANKPDVAATAAAGDGMAPPDASPVDKGTRPKQGTPLHARRASFSKTLNSMPSLPSHARARPVPRAPPITERVQARDPVADARALLEAPPGTFLSVDVADPVTRLELLSSDLRRGARYADEQLVEVRRTAKSAIDGVRRLSSLASTLRALEELAATEAIACDAELAIFGAARRALELAACLVVGNRGCLVAPDYL